MTAHSVQHGTFTIERRYAFAPAVVFAAFADPAAKRKWFIEGEGWTIDGYEADFRVGGAERSRFRFGDGPPMGNETLYMDIVPDRRIVIAYAMTLEGTPFSASLATIEFLPDGDGTKLVYTEQAAFLDGKDEVASRRDGCGGLLEALALYLDGGAA
ncbi:SRPBCC family protein [Kumtagia ephedrae]|jgi:uncharacterized protein YndB with AHSA1/START domain|uniref:Polyketide cyclase n=1 Tax=Kumtagia ephedrae TaxID=2116701 RepID=A0A2P7S7B2_9HYPH|nr:SRPBCC family protein [Mesorhizobium ephedrae]PSJ58337.1 polyketide cyclase [Mesorhizobium ephedrae]